MASPSRQPGKTPCAPRSAALRRTGVNLRCLSNSAPRKRAQPTPRRTSSATGLFKSSKALARKVRRHGPITPWRASPALRNGATPIRRETSCAGNRCRTLGAHGGRTPREMRRAAKHASPHAERGDLYAAHVWAERPLRLTRRQRRPPNAVTLFPREAAPKRGSRRRQPRSAQGLLDRLELDADARWCEHRQSGRLETAATAKRCRQPWRKRLCFALLTPWATTNATIRAQYATSAQRVRADEALAGALHRFHRWITETVGRDVRGADIRPSVRTRTG